MDRKVLLRVRTIIERDSIVNHLLEQGFAASGGDRPIMVEVSEASRLAYGAVSLLSPGYEIFVPPAQEDAARKTVEEFQSSLITPVNTESQRDANARRFFACSFFSVVIPGVMAIVALYWFAKDPGILSRRPGLTIISLVLNFLSFYLVYLWVSHQFVS